MITDSTFLKSRDLGHKDRASERPGRTYRHSEIGRVVSFLVSGAATGMTGDVIYVGGGLHLMA
jgi:enoyl-[acyl-carrier protein] reductase I